MVCVCVCVLLGFARRVEEWLPRGVVVPPSPLCHGRGDTRSFRPTPPCAQSSPNLSRAALAKRCCRSCGLVPTAHAHLAFNHASSPSWACQAAGGRRALDVGRVGV